MIEYYYNELLKTRNSFKNIKKAKSLNDDKYDIKEVLKLIIDNHMEHLLTPSMNYYLIASSIYLQDIKISFSEILYNKILALTDSIKRYEILVSFIRNMTIGFINNNNLRISSNGKEISTIILANEFERHLYTRFRSSCYIVGANNTMKMEDYNVLAAIFRIIVGYCLINNKDDFDLLSKKVIDNYQDIIDELILQGIIKNPYTEDNSELSSRYFYKMEELSVYIINKFQNDYQKEIR